MTLMCRCALRMEYCCDHLVTCAVNTEMEGKRPGTEETVTPSSVEPKTLVWWLVPGHLDLLDTQILLRFWDLPCSLFCSCSWSLFPRPPSFSGPPQRSPCFNFTFPLFLKPLILGRLPSLDPYPLVSKSRLALVAVIACRCMFCVAVTLRSQWRTRPRHFPVTPPPTAVLMTWRASEGGDAWGLLPHRPPLGGPQNTRQCSWRGWVPPFPVKTMSGLRLVLAFSAKVFGLTQPTHTSMPRYQHSGRDARLETRWSCRAFAAGGEADVHSPAGFLS